MIHYEYLYTFTVLDINQVNVYKRSKHRATSGYWGKFEKMPLINVSNEAYFGLIIAT